MPLLTDRQEPEDFDRPDPDDPNEYALRYLFNPNRPEVELSRTGRTLFYSGAATNLLALALYSAWLEFNFVPWQLGLALVVVIAGGVAAFRLRRKAPATYLLALLPALVTLITILLMLIIPQPGDQTGFFLFFIPGSLTLLISVFVLRAAKHQAPG